MNNGMRPSVFITRIRHTKKTAVKLHFESKRVRNDIETFLKRFDAAESILTL